MVFYVAALITLVSLIIAFFLIKNPTAEELTILFSCCFVAEWGAQIIGASQASSALELIVLLKYVTNSRLENDKSRAKLRMIRKLLMIGLSAFSLIIILVPIFFIVESSIIFKKDADKTFSKLIQNSDYFEIQIEF